jgi:hypothetical protein
MKWFISIANTFFLKNSKKLYSTFQLKDLLSVEHKKIFHMFQCSTN